MFRSLRKPLRFIIVLSSVLLLAYLVAFLQLHESPNLYYLRRIVSFAGLSRAASPPPSSSRPTSPASVASLSTSAAAKVMSSSSGDGSVPSGVPAGGDMTSEGCGDIPRIENPRTYKPKGVQKKTPKGMGYYEVIPPNVTRPDLAIIQYYDVSFPLGKRALEGGACF